MRTVFEYQKNVKHIYIIYRFLRDEITKEFCKRPYKRVTRNKASLLFVGSKLIHPANPLMYEPNPARSPLIALSCLVDRALAIDLKPYQDPIKGQR